MSDIYCYYYINLINPCLCESQTQSESLKKRLLLFQHINELGGQIDISAMLNKAEGMFYQIKEAEHTTDNIRLILGLPLLGNQTSFSSHEQSPFEDSSELSNENRCGSEENNRLTPDEIAYERAINVTLL